MKRIPKNTTRCSPNKNIKNPFSQLRRTNFCPRFVDIFTGFVFVDVFFLFSESTMVNHQEKSFNHRLRLSHQDTRKNHFTQFLLAANNEKTHGCLGNIGGYTVLPFVIVLSHIPLYESLLNNQYFMESKKFFLCGSFKKGLVRSQHTDKQGNF